VTVNELTNKRATTQTQDFTLVGLRLVLLCIVSGFLIVGGRGASDLGGAGAVLVTVNLVLVGFALGRAIHPYTQWVVMAGDFLSVVAFAPLVYLEPLLALLLVGGLVFLSYGRLGMPWGVVNAALAVVGLVASVSYNAGGIGAVTNLTDAYLLPGTIFVFVAVSLAVMIDLRDVQITRRTRDIRTEAERRLAYVREMEKRTIGITEMAQMLNATLNYQRVLDAALNVGSLALHDRDSGGFAAVVFLYRPDDRMLYIETARGLSRRDENLLVSGKAGLIGDTLQICEPMFAGSVRSDPELKRFLTFRTAKSVVTVPLRAGYDNYGVLLFASQQPFAFDERYRMFLEAIGVQTTIALQNAVLYQGLADEKERIVEVEEDARRKLARDLHDGPTQAVSAIAMRLSVLQKMIRSQPDKVASELAKMEKLARKTTTEIRGMMFTLRPLALESKGLNAALTQLAEKMDAIYDQRVDVLVSPEAERALTSHQSGTIFYIIEEAVNNARKHAKSEVIRARVSRYEDVILVEIADDGVGFNVDAVMKNYEGRTSLGMVNLQERTELVDGTLTIESKPGEGTTISVVLPVDPTGNRNTQPSRKAVEQDSSKPFKLNAIR